MDNEPMYRCTICGQEGSVGRCCGDDTRIPLNDAAEKEMHDITMREIVHMSKATLEQIKATARAEALRDAADRAVQWSYKNHGPLIMGALNRSALKTAILADKQEPPQ